MTISILAAAMLLQTAPASATQPRWTLALSDESGEYWLDQSSLRREGPLYRFRLRQVPREGPQNIRSVILDYQLDCPAQTLAMESMEAFDAAGKTVATRTVSADWLDRDRIYVGSPEEKIYERVCPASARKPLASRPPPPVMMVAPPVQAPPPPPVMLAPPAPPPPPPPRPANYPAERATPVVPLHTLFSADDYPAAALRNEQEGSVLFRMDVDKQGRVAACTVASSSGSSALDSATCRLITARARFKPARNAKGKKMADSVLGKILWQIPDEPAPPAAPAGE